MVDLKRLNEMLFNNNPTEKLNIKINQKVNLILLTSIIISFFIFILGVVI